MKPGFALLLFALCLAVGCAGRDDAGVKIAQAKASTYYGKWTTDELLNKYCNKATWTYDKTADRVVFDGMLKGSGDMLQVRFQVIHGWEDKSNTRKGWIVIDDGATRAGKELPLWKREVFADETRQMNAGKDEK